MIHRVLHGTFWLKALAVGMVLAGFSEKSASLLTGGAGLLVCAKQVRDGIREQYWEPENEQLARHWDDLVWGNTRWLNHRGERLETPDEGIERLAGPYRLPQAVPEDRHRAFPAEPRPPHLLDLP